MTCLEAKLEKKTRLSEKMDCLIQEVRINLVPKSIRICIVPFNKKNDENSKNLNERVRHINGVIREIRRPIILPLRFLDKANELKGSLLEVCSSHGINFDHPKGSAWPDKIFQQHLDRLKIDLVEGGRFTSGPPPDTPFYRTRSLETLRGAKRLQIQLLEQQEQTSWLLFSRERNERISYPLKIGGTVNLNDGA